ncbi:penicillin-binding transpeptidase domain-containing protein [Nocardioides nematodiphilus]|uniref:penicillin-binding transpeptidase domain-containing protein n=1 Tax=Nocardioides nematodiphilus TaxID=2849669 RepID=UPI001CDA188B|nr:penicillin-binding transpeptidase domain-containing protein [Nocardioides nematodiphilus]MCA1981833.1 penicillin-binding protein [Nocardioides nematodiphilus]
MRRICLGLVTLALTLSGCGGGGGVTPPNEPDRASNVVALAAALSGAMGFDLVRFADGSTAAEAKADYQRIIAGMTGTKPRVTAHGTTLDWRWPMRGGAWTYSTTATKQGSDGPITWSPTIVNDALTDPQATLRTTTVQPQRGQIMGAGGQVLVTERPVVIYGLDKARLGADGKPAPAARRLAQRLGVDVGGFVKQVKAAGPQQFVPAITYRAAEAPLTQSQLDAIPGAVAQHTSASLAPTKDFAAPILGRVGPVTAEMVKKDPQTYHPGDLAGTSGLEARYDTQLRGTPGTVVQRVAGDGTITQIFDAPPVDGKPLVTTLDLRLQTLAERLLSGVRPASALVALRPSTGRILAAANGPGNGGLNLATYGRMPPGSTFKTIDSLALLREGRDPESTVPCTPSLTVDGKKFTNDSDYPASGLGDVSLTTAIANSCNTAMISQRDSVAHDDLVGAAASLGFGIDHDTGFPAYFGQAPAPASETERAADMIGQGKVLASPMVMASVIGAIQRGVSTVPTLIADTHVKAGGDPISAPEHTQLLQIFRAVVQRGTGAGLADIPGKPVIAKTGTAEFDRDGKRLVHAWMIAAQGDLAVAVYVDEGVTGAETAGPIVEGFLRGAH